MRGAGARNYLCRLWLALLLAPCVAAAQPAGLPAPERSPGLAQAGKPPLLFQADKISYDQATDTVTAQGHVEADYGGRILLAKQVTYQQSSGLVTAAGDVVLTDAEGNTMFAETAQLTEDLREGVIRGILLKMANNTRMAANSATRTQGNTTELDHAVYTPCKICTEHKGHAPSWQIRAEKVRHDQAAKRISYRNATFDAFGVPVIYTPYFSHADPSVKRKSGLLVPGFSSSTDLGVVVETPYFWSIDPSRDLTLSPMFTSREGAVMKGEYRARTKRGRLMLAASGTRADDRDDFGNRTGETISRGHIFSHGRFALSSADVWGFDIERATDDTYMKRYDLSSADTLTSRLFTEHISGRNFGSADFLLFQGLNREDDPGLTPMILPLLNYSAISSPSAAGGRFNISGNALVLQRRDGQDTNRISVTGGWQRNYVSGLGEVYTLFTDMRGDLYYVNDLNGQDGANNFTGRALPQVGVEWRLPMSKYSGGVSQVVEPIAQLIYTPYGGNPDEIPNEDSGSFEFDGTNLFSHTRFPGYDRWEEGPRANLGAKWGAYGANGGYVNVLFGQVWRLKEDASFARDTGLDTQRSDYVGSIAVSPAPWLDVLHRFRLDRDDFGYRRSEVELLAGPNVLRLNFAYARLVRELTDAALTSREEVTAGLSSQFTDHWNARAMTRRDLEANSTIETEAGVFYSDDCIEYGLFYDRRYTRDRDIEPSTVIGIKINLRTLG